MVKYTQISIAVALACMNGAAYAAGADETSSASSGSTGLDEIVVTAERRESNLQKTPIAITAIDANVVAQFSPRTISDIFEEFARDKPANVAVLYQDHTLTYAELAAGANRYAHWALGQGGPQDSQGAVKEAATGVGVAVVEKVGAPVEEDRQDRTDVRVKACWFSRNRAVFGP